MTLTLRKNGVREKKRISELITGIPEKQGFAIHPGLLGLNFIANQVGCIYLGVKEVTRAIWFDHMALAEIVGTLLSKLLIPASIRSLINIPDGDEEHNRECIELHFITSNEQWHMMHVTALFLLLLRIQCPLNGNEVQSSDTLSLMKRDDQDMYNGSGLNQLLCACCQVQYNILHSLTLSRAGIIHAIADSG